MKLRNGVEMPTVAFGCAFGNWTETEPFQGFLPERAWRAFTLGLDCGYRAFDGAHAYGTERILGTLLGERFAKGELDRQDVFLTTKLAHPATPPHVNISHLRTWNSNEVPDIAARVRDDLMRTLDDLTVGSVDLLLMHWPGPFDNEDAAFARKARRTIWETFLSFQEKGAARALGVCNFTVQHLEQLMEDFPGAGPMVDQVEIHPYCRDLELEEFCGEHDIVVTAYAPFASGAFGLLEDPVLVRIAEKHGIGVGQAVLRWHVQHGRTVLPKSSSEKHMRSNLDLFSFRLDEEDMAAIDALGTGEARRTCPAPADVL